uniref:Gypsy retrotransposon integrase-like protein 1 n=1 Tax=Anolis carolinensis TaxID=28377 RepID=A0A803TM34_ANOCA
MWEVQGVTGTFVWDITSLPRYDVILGMDWLALVNPQVDWVMRKITFRRQECFTLNPTQPDMEGVPAEYGEFSDVFCKKEADKLPPHRPYDCAIRLAEGAKLPAGRLYALTVPERQALREFLDENLAKGFIRPSSSPTAAPVFFVAKKTGDLRLVCDYRVLNKHTIRDRYPLPLISELLSRVQGAKVFTKLDLRGAYNLIRIREGDEWKTAFNTCFGCHEFRVMPFGLCNAPAVFQRFINDVFRDLIDQFVVIYLDDILIFSKDEREHRQHVKQVLHRLRANGLFAKASKCVFHVPEVEFLGHVVSGRELKMDPHKVDAVNSWQELKTKKDVQRFLGFANYYREFIPNFAKLTVPLTQLLRKKQPFVWGREAHDAFLQLKSSFQADNILIHPDVDKPFVVEADASSYALGAVLSQRDSSGTLRPCGFYSRQLTPFEQNYTIWEKELLAIKVAFEVWRHWLEGARHQIVVRSDHKNLEHLQTAKKLNQRQIRWALFFSRFNFKVQFVEGKANLRADALSRKPEFKTNEQVVCQTILPTASLCVVENEIGLHDQIIEAQKEDVWTQEQLMLLSAGNRTILPHLQDQNGVLVRRGQVYVPVGALRLEVIRAHHDEPMAGHFGRFKTVQLITRNYWWPKMRQDILRFCDSCAVCQQSKTPVGRPRGLLSSLPVPERPWQIISMDFISDLPKSGGYTCIWVVVDLFSKLAHFIPCSTIPAAPTLALLFTKHIYRLHGAPEVIISDRAPQFVSRFWRHFHECLGTKLNVSSAFHPQTDGQSERVNGLLEQYLRCFCLDQPTAWVKWLPVAEFAYNNAVHTSSQHTPFELTYGFHPRGGVAPSTNVVSSDPVYRSSEMAALHDVARHLLLEAKATQKTQADRHRQAGEELEEGDLVWLSSKYIKQAGGKFAPRYLGPFPIVKKISSVAFRLRLPSTFKIHPVFHRSLLKLDTSSRRGAVAEDITAVSPPSEEEAFVRGDSVMVEPHGSTTGRRGRKTPRESDTLEERERKRLRDIFAEPSDEDSFEGFTERMEEEMVSSEEDDMEWTRVREDLGATGNDSMEGDWGPSGLDPWTSWRDGTGSTAGDAVGRSQRCSSSDEESDGETPGLRRTVDSDEDL